jgi:HK97 family phage major capsid protein
MDRNTYLSQAHQLLQKPGPFSREDSAKVEQLLAMADAMVDHDPIRRGAMAQRDAELGRPARIVGTPDARFLAYLRQGKEALTPEERMRIHPGSERVPGIRAAQGVGSGSTGAYLVPSSFSDTFFSVLKATDAIFYLATPWETPTGSTSGYPILDDTANEAAVVAENTASSEVDTTFAALAFGLTPLWRSGYLRCSVELVNDSHFDLESLIAGAAAVRFARGIGAAFITTLLAAAAAGVTTASTTVIAADEIIKLTGTVDSAYLSDASFLMQRSTFITLSQLVGSSGNFLFPTAFDAAGRPLILGFPVYFSPSMGAMTAGQQPVTFGSHSHFLQRRVRNSLSIKVLVELFALYAQVGYEAHWRVDGGLLVSGSNIPVAALTMHS